MMRRLRQLADRVLGMFPTPRPLFDIGVDQKLTIVMETVTAPTKAEEIDRVDHSRLLADLDSLLAQMSKDQMLTPEVRAWWARVESSRSAFK